MKRLVYIIVFALGLTACYDDKGFMKRFTGKVCWKSILR